MENNYPNDIGRDLKSLHVNGTVKMSTEDILDYFKLRTPSKVTWINDNSCNVSFETEEECQCALVSLSTGILDEEGILPLYCWNKSLPYKGSQIILRYATPLDRKDPNCHQKSQFYARMKRKSRSEKKRKERAKKYCSLLQKSQKFIKEER